MNGIFLTEKFSNKMVNSETIQNILVEQNNAYLKLF